MNLKLISFELCPFVQRSVIALLEKGMAYEITYLSMQELRDPPQWFRDISPFGKVPVLRVDDVTVFESAVIMEYIDEINPPTLHPADPLQRALNRAWMKFGEELLFSQYRYATAADEAAFAQGRQELTDSLNRLEAVLGDGAFFNGSEFSLIDASYAPFFMRLDILEQHHTSGFYENRPRLSRWAEACRERETVANSVVPDLAHKYIEFIKRSSEHALKVFGGVPESVS